MGKRLVLLSLLLFTLFPLAGCWDRVELENLGFIQALGLDLDKNSKDPTITTMVAIPSKLGVTSEGGGSGEGPGVILISMKSPSIFEAFNQINTTINREVSLLQNQILILGEELTRQGVQPWIDNLIRYREMRRTLLIFTCQGKAADILKVQPKLESNPAEYLSDLVMLSKRTGMFPLTNLHNFMNRYEAFAQQNYLPILAPYQPKGGSEAPDGEGGDQKSDKPQKPRDIRMVGTAVFNGDKVVGKLDLYETQVLQMLTNDFHEAFLTIPDPQNKNLKIIFRLLTSKPTQIKYTQKKEAHFDVKLVFEANIVSIQSSLNYTQPDKERLLSKYIAAALKKRINKVIKKTQTDFRSDIFGFGAKVKNTMLTSTEWDNYHWANKYPKSKTNVNVKVFIRRVGLQFQPPQQRE